MLRLRLASHSQSPAFAQHDRRYFGMSRFGHCGLVACSPIVATARDDGTAQQVVQKEFVIKVVEGITVAWKVPAHVNVTRIEGSVEVSNSPVDDVDLAFDVKAVAEDGRATEIGYQHFPLKKGTIGMALPFGENLPHGAYVVYVNVNGEVARRNAIYKRGLRTPTALQVVVGP